MFFGAPGATMNPRSVVASDLAVVVGVAEAGRTARLDAIVPCFTVESGRAVPGGELRHWGRWVGHGERRVSGSRAAGTESNEGHVV